MQELKNNLVTQIQVDNVNKELDIKLAINDDFEHDIIIWIYYFAF